MLTVASVLMGGLRGLSPIPTCYRESVTFAVGVPTYFQCWGQKFLVVLLGTKTERPEILQESVSAGIRDSKSEEEWT